ncbi:hypothetical protein MTO96_011124 [Rhipicephalus appendiculatus]
MKGELGPRLRPFNSRLTCLRPYFIMSMLLFCIIACALVFVIGLRKDTKLNAADLLKSIAHRRGKAAFHEPHSGDKKATVAAAAETRSVAVRARVTKSSTTVSKMAAGESRSTKGNASVYDAPAVQTDASVDAEKQEKEGKTGADPVEHGNATTGYGGKQWGQDLVD